MVSDALHIQVVFKFIDFKCVIADSGGAKIMFWCIADLSGLDVLFRGLLFESVPTQKDGDCSRQTAIRFCRRRRWLLLASECRGRA